MAEPWVKDGYDCYLFDGQHPQGVTQEGSIYKVGMWLERDATTLETITGIAGEGVKFVFGFPECTDLAVSGAAHFKSKLSKDPLCQQRATERAKLVEDIGNYYNCPWGAENPVSVLSTLWRKPDFSFHPWEYGGFLPLNDVHPLYPQYIMPQDAYPKKTCIWCGNGFVQPMKNPVAVAPGYSQQHKKLGGKSLKTKNIRSATPRGFAIAVHMFNR